jgi:hypothetical protein
MRMQRVILSFGESVSVGSCWIRVRARSAAREEIWPGKLSAGGIGQEIDRRRENYFMARQPSFSRRTSSQHPCEAPKTKIAPTLLNYSKARVNEVFLLPQSLYI